MLDAIPPGNPLSGDEFDELELPLRMDLLAAQQSLAAANRATILIIAGVDGAGKGALAQRLCEWMDPRGIETNTFWERSDEEDSRPYFWRFWRRLPPRGEIGIFLGSWYTRLGRKAMSGELTDGEFAEGCQRIWEFERMLAEDGAIIIKLWLQVGRDARRQQLQERAGKQQNPRVTDRPYELQGDYDLSQNIASEMIQRTNSLYASWHLLDAEDKRYRDITAGRVVAGAMQRHELSVVGNQIDHAVEKPSTPSSLADVDLSRVLAKDDYKDQLSKWQRRLQDLAWQRYREGRSLIAVFEGWDAAGKGSSLRRVTNAVDPRLYHLARYAAPSDEELKYHYLWRFWRHIQRDGRFTLFDRSWYGRVLVERVEGFAAENEWQRAYYEIAEFERQLLDNESTLCKFWIHISKDEQLKRFQERESTPHKRYKITQEDWRNREKWSDYETAVNDMLAATSTRAAPWTLIAGNDKRYARIQILKTLCQAMADDSNEG